MQCKTIVITSVNCHKPHSKYTDYIYSFVIFTSVNCITASPNFIELRQIEVQERL